MVVFAYISALSENANLKHLRVGECLVKILLFLIHP